MSINIAIVDDIAINRKTIREKLRGVDDIQIVFEASNGADFIQSIQKNENGLGIDVVLMDLEMPKMNGIEAISKCAAWAPHIKFIVVTVFEDNDKIFEAIKAGAHGYILKEDTTINIVEAIQNAHLHNGAPMSPSIARRVMDLMLKKYSVDIGSEESVLSSRENDILKCLVEGKIYKKIGDELCISPLTVRKHVSNIYEKLHVNSRAQIINLAHEKKWI